MANQRAADAYKANFWTTRALWDLYGQITAAEGSDRTKDLINYMRWRTGDPVAKLPQPVQRKENAVSATTQLRRSLTSYLGDTADGAVLNFLGDQAESYDVDGLVHAFRNAIAGELDDHGISLAGDEFYAPYPVPDGIDELIEAAIEAVDLGELAEKFDRDIQEGGGLDA